MSEDVDDGLEGRFGDGPAQDDFEARQWRGSVAARLFGREASPLSIGRFRILKRVGSGGAGVVYSAWDPKLERRVAVKVLRGEHDPREVEREAKLLAKLSHPNVVAVYDVGECDGRSFLAMEFVDGPTLLEHLEHMGSWQDRLTLLEQAAAGLHAAHEVGVVHGDVKPSNLLVGSDGRLRVTDFGTAHAGEDRLLGATPAYMAPEQAQGGAATTASDQFSLCATAFEVFYGARPYGGDTAEEVRAALVEGRRTEPADPHAIPGWLRDTLDRGLSEDPSARYDGIAALLEAWRRGSRSRRGWIAAGMAAFWGTAAIVASMQSEPAADPCQPTRDRIASLWNAERKGGLEARFRAHDQAFAVQAWARVESEIDAHVGELDVVLSEACGLSDEETSLRRRLCVERRLIEVSALLDVLDSPDPAVVEESVQALTLLTDPRGCALDARPLDPPDEAERRGVLEAVARARALRGVGKVDESLEVLRLARSRAHELRDPSVTARILLELGETLALQQGISERTPTLATLEAALLAADAADAPHLTARALLSLALANFRATRFDEALRWLDRLEAHLEGLDAERMRSQAALLRALIRIMRDDVDEAATVAALERLRETDVRDTWLALALNNVGELEFERTDDVSARLHYLQALEIWSEALGPSHPRTAGAHGNLGEVELLAADYDAALEHFTRALEIRSAAWGEDSYMVAHTRAHVADAHHLAGRAQDAEREYRGVLAFVQRQVPLGDAETFFELESGSDQLAPWALHGLALLALERGDPEAALSWSSQVDPRARVRSGRHADLAFRFDVRALALIELDRLDEARAVLDQFDGAWSDAYGARIYKGAYGALARAELELRSGDAAAACVAAGRAAKVVDPGLPAKDRARLEQLRQSCSGSQVH